MKLVAGITSLLQTEELAGTLTPGVGFTVILYEEGVPVHPFAVGVTEIEAETGAEPVFIAVNEAMSPVPLDTSPMVVLELVHENVPPAGVLTKLVAGTLPLVQTVISAGTATVGVG